MGPVRVQTRSVRFRTVIAQEWTKDTTLIHLRARSELARDLRYRPVEGL